MVASLTCQACAKDLARCICPAVENQIFLRLRSPEGKSLPPPYYNSLVRRASQLMESAITAKTSDACCRWDLDHRDFLGHSLPIALRK